MTNPYTKEVEDIERKGIAVGLKLLRSEVRHLGTEVNLQVLESIFEELKTKIDMVFSTEVEDILVDKNNQVSGIITNKKEIINAKYVLLSVGRPGAEWLSKIMKKHKINVANNRVDIGVRVETNNIVMNTKSSFIIPKSKFKKLIKTIESKDVPDIDQKGLEKAVLEIADLKGKIVNDEVE